MKFRIYELGISEFADSFKIVTSHSFSNVVNHSFSNVSDNLCSIRVSQRCRALHLTRPSFRLPPPVKLNAPSTRTIQHFVCS